MQLFALVARYKYNSTIAGPLLACCEGHITTSNWDMPFNGVVAHHTTPPLHVYWLLCTLPRHRHKINGGIISYHTTGMLACTHLPMSLLT
jgi:hypothetical protein